MTSTETTRCGFVAIIGQPNVGKSTLLNHMLGFKLSITSSKPQTTRHRLLGISTEADEQVIYVDTPGLHRQAKRALNHYLNQSALQSLQGIDVALWVVDCQQFDAGDQWVLSHLNKLQVPIILVMNKMDKLKERAQLLPLIALYREKIDLAEIVPVSALKGEQVEKLKHTIKKYLPISPFLFPTDQVSDRGHSFLVSEIIREKLMRSLAKELPYALTVTIEAFADEKDLVRISAVIWVDKDSHKPIVIGKHGDHLKKIGKLARHDIERHFGKKAYLQLWVKIKAGWTDNSKTLKQLGYD